MSKSDATCAVVVFNHPRLLFEHFAGRTQATCSLVSHCTFCIITKSVDIGIHSQSECYTESGGIMAAVATAHT